jgi:geranylgeranyl diphosphate synthase type II
MSTVAVRSAQLPPPVPPTVRRFRQPKKNIPQTKQERDQILSWIRAYTEETKLVPPLPLEELQGHTDKVMAIHAIDAVHRDYVGVLMANESWREALATVPFEKRLLLMPKVPAHRKQMPRAL